jgi:hypothetical protein
VPDLPDAQRNPPEIAREPCPVFGPVERSAGACHEMKTTRLVGTLSPERTGVANVAAIEEPDATERDTLVDQPLNEALEDHVERSFLSKCE